MERMCGVSPRFSWITSTAPFGASPPPRRRRSARRWDPLKRISSPSAVAGAPPAEDAGVARRLGAGRRGRRRASALVAGALVEELASPSSPQAASRAVAAAPVTPSRPRRRSASRRDSSPASQSRATSCTM